MTLKRSTRLYWNSDHNSTSVLLNLAQCVCMPCVHNHTNMATHYLSVEYCTSETHAWGCFSAPAPLCWVFGSGAWKKEKTVLVHFLHKDYRRNYFNIYMVLDGSMDKQELSVVKRVVLIYTFFGVHPKAACRQPFLPLLGENFHAQLQHRLFIMINFSWDATHNYTKEITLRLH